MKKHIKLLLIVALVIALAAACESAFAEESAELTYTIYDGEVEITGFTGLPTEIVIPSEVEGYPVTKIADGAFCECYSLEELVIPEGVKNIGYGAFCSCENLTSVTIPNTVESIGEHSLCYSPWYESLKDEFVIVGDGILIKYNGHNSVVNIPESVKKINHRVFLGMDDIVEVNIPESVTYLGVEALSCCPSLETVNVPKSVKDIGYCVFSDTPWIESFDDEFVIVGDGILIKYNGSETKITVPNTVRYVADAFPDTITDVALPDSVQVIGEMAFGTVCNDMALSHISIPDSVTEIRNYAFLSCTALSEITLPAGLTDIGEGVFCSCTGLTDINIPDSVSKIGESAFERCSGITEIRIPDRIKRIEASTFSGCENLTIVYIPDNVTIISDTAFSECPKLKSILIPGSVTEIGESAFYLSGLTDIVIPDGMKKIGPYAFAHCYDLSSVTIPDSVSEIGDCAFCCCGSLTSIAIPKGVTKLSGTFDDCDKLKDVFYSGTKEQWCLIKTSGWYDVSAVVHCSDGDVDIGKYSSVAWELTDDGTMYLHGYEEISVERLNGKYIRPWEDCCRSVNEIVIADGITVIGDSVFAKRSSIGKLTIPESVIRIENRAFCDCTGLKDIYYPGSRAQWFGIGFYKDSWQNVSATVHCSDGDIEIVSGELMTSGQAPADFAYIVDRGSCGWQVEWEHKDNGTLFITGADMVSSNEWDMNLCKYVYPWDEYSEEIQRVVFSDGIPIIGKYMFANYCELTSVTMPDSLKRIEEDVFDSCTSLTDVTIPEGVTEIGKHAFYNCTGLTDITIPEGVTALHKYLFAGCSNLRSISIPESITGIEDKVFSGCSALQDIYYSGTVIQWNQIDLEKTALDGVTATVHCADGDIALSSEAVSSEEELGLVLDGGSCGSNSTWELTDGGILRIDGSGEIEDYVWDSKASQYTYPWGKYKDRISTVIISDGITKIGENAFSDLNALTKVTLPDSVTEIGNEAFAYCYALAGINLPESVEKIGDSAFAGCGLTDMAIPCGVTEIGTAVFCACFDLRTVTLPESITEISSHLFVSCRELKEIEIPDGVTTIQSSAFSDCKKLSSLTLPDSVERIAPRAFDGCTRLKDVYYSGSRSRWYEIIFETESYTNKGPWEEVSAIVHCNDGDLAIGSAEVPAKVPGSEGAADNSSAAVISDGGKCGDNAAWALSGDGTLTIDGSGKMTSFDVVFSDDYSSSEINCPWNKYRDMILSVVISNGITDIGSYAFSDCDCLASVSIPDSVTEIGSCAFENCNSLKSVTLPDSIKIIRFDAFNGCSGLDGINIPDSVEVIDSGAFSGTAWLSSRNDKFVVCGKGILLKYNGTGSSVTVPKNVTVISDAFKNCSSLKKVTVPGNVKKLQGEAFAGCTHLKTVTLENGVETIGLYAFSGCSALSKIVLPESITSIENWAFSECTSLKEISIPVITNRIGNFAFNECSKLSTIEIYSNKLYAGVGAFNCENLKEIIFHGTKAQWNEIGISQDAWYGNSPTVRCTDGDIQISA